MVGTLPVHPWDWVKVVWIARTALLMPYFLVHTLLTSYSLNNPFPALKRVTEHFQLSITVHQCVSDSQFKARHLKLTFLKII